MTRAAGGEMSSERHTPVSHDGPSLGGIGHRRPGDFTPWILTWGDTVEGLEPPLLRERLSAIASGMARRYAKS